MRVELQQASSILTRSSGYLGAVCSHSLQPYVGCSFGNSLCGIGCYVQHNSFLTRGRPWGSFLTVKQNAAEVYQQTCDKERSWARRNDKRFSIFCSSSTDPFLPQERKYGITQGILVAMLEQPPAELILQTHVPAVTDQLSLLRELAQRTDLRIHLSIESDRDRLPGLPPPAASVSARLKACKLLHSAGLRVIVTVSPLLPIEQPLQFFRMISEVSSGVVIDHFIQGDGSKNGHRTRKTGLFTAMQQIDPASVHLDYRERIIEIARNVMPGRVGVGQQGFAGKFS